MTRKRQVAIIQSNCVTKVLPLFEDVDVTKLEARRSYERENVDNSPSVDWIKAEDSGVRNVFVDFDEENHGKFMPHLLETEGIEKFNCVDMSIQRIEMRFQSGDLIERINRHGQKYWEWDEAHLDDDYNLYAEFTSVKADSQFHDTPEEVHKLNEHRIKELNFNKMVLQMTDFETELSREYGRDENVAARPVLEQEGGEMPFRPEQDINGLPNDVKSVLEVENWPEEERTMYLNGQPHTAPAAKIIFQESSDIEEWVAVDSTS